MAKEKEEEQVRLTVLLDRDLDQLIRDTSMILGIKPSDLAARAFAKYIEAIKAQVGSKFSTALEAIQAVRDADYAC